MNVGNSPPICSPFEEEKPQIVIKYHKVKMFGRFICFWGPISLVSAVMMHRATQKSSSLMFVIFLFLLLGAIIYNLHLLNMKDVRLYNGYIIQRNRFFFKKIRIDLHFAKYSFWGGWFEELMTITSPKQRKTIIVFDGYVKRKELQEYFEALSHMTGKGPEELSWGWDKEFYSK